MFRSPERTRDYKCPSRGFCWYGTLPLSPPRTSPARLVVVVFCSSALQQLFFPLRVKSLLSKTFPCSPALARTLSEAKISSFLPSSTHREPFFRSDFFGGVASPPLPRLLTILLRTVFFLFSFQLGQATEACAPSPPTFGVSLSLGSFLLDNYPSGGLRVAATGRLFSPRPEQTLFCILPSWS